MAGIIITACAGGAATKPPAQSPSQLPAGAIAAVPVGPYTSDNSVTAFDSLWLGEGTGKLYRIDLKTNHLTAIPIGDFSNIPSRIHLDRRVPGGLTAGFGSIWATRPDAQSLVRIDSASNRITVEVHLPAVPSEACTGSDSIWVTGYDYNTLMRVDPTTNQVVGYWSQLGGVTGCTEANRVLWVADQGGRNVIKFDVDTSKVVTRFPVDGAVEFVAVVSGSLWIEEKSPYLVARLDATTGRVLDQVPSNAADGGFFYSDGALWASNLRIDPANGQSHELTELGGLYIYGVGEGALWVRDRNAGAYLYRYPLAVG